MLLNLRTRLSLSYVFLALLCVLLISVMANLFLERQFRDYIKSNLERQNGQIVRLIGDQYRRNHELRRGDLEEIGVNALEQGLILRVRDAYGSLLWDATTHNNGMCQRMLLHMSENMISRYPDWKGGYVENHYPLTVGAQKVGTVEIGYYGPFYYNDADLAFINTLNRILTIVTVLTLLMALLIGAWMAKRIGDPITRAIGSAEKIAQGEYEIQHFAAADIKEIHQLEHSLNELGQTLKNQENLRKRLTADVAHELRTPLATLQSHVEAMLDGVWQIDAVRLRGLHDEITRLNRLVSDLNKLSKYESGDGVLDKSCVDLSELVRQTVFNFEPEFLTKDVKLVFRGSPLFIDGDRDRLSQVAINLIDNSLKYTPSGGKVEVIVGDSPGGAILRVKDNGVGINPDDLPYIFERFYRADKSRTRSTGGSGIGLAIAKAIVEAHGGSISVKSEPGKGSEFLVNLPVGGNAE